MNLNPDSPEIPQSPDGRESQILSQPPVHTAASLASQETIGLDLARFAKKFEMTPSGGIADRWCVHPTGSVSNVIKHMSFDVARTLVDFLNGDIQDPGFQILAAHILEKEGYLKPEDLAKIKADWAPVAPEATGPVQTVVPGGVFPENLKVNHEVTVNRQQIADLLSTALEGGIEDWGYVAKGERQAPEKIEFQHMAQFNDPKVDYPMNGGFITIKDLEGDMGPWVLDGAAIERGIRLMASTPEGRPHFENLIQDNHDAETGDVFLQYALLGEITFG
jgi:hypothetical protein